MNVLYLTMNPNRVSTTVPTEGWMRLLPAKGLRPVLVSRECGDLHNWAVSQGIPAYQNDLPFPNKFQPVGFLRSLWKLRKIVKRHKIDLIHCNEQDIYPIGQYLGRVCRVPVVVSVHFTLPPDYSRWAFGGKKQPTRIFFISEGNLDACRPAVDGVISEDRWRMLPNGLDLSRFQPDAKLRQEFRTRHGLDGTFALGNACALRERKQLEHLCEIAARNDDPRLRIVIAGGSVPDEADYAAGFLDWAKRTVGDRLVLLGHVTDLRDFYNGIDLFVNTSREEACSISVIESMASGCPVVGYASKSVHTQILPDGGEITPQDDVEALSAAIGRWMGSGDLSDRRKSARRQALRFDIRTLSDQLWDEYQQVLESAGRRSPAMAVQ